MTTLKVFSASLRTSFLLSIFLLSMGLSKPSEPQIFEKIPQGVPLTNCQVKYDELALFLCDTGTFAFNFTSEEEFSTLDRQKEKAIDGDIDKGNIVFTTEQKY